ncbi:hypothetical protein BH11GEM1_BH11GEM1_00790 [soil metagenome]
MSQFRFVPVLVGVLLACHDDRPHVFQAPPSAVARPVVSPAAPPASPPIPAVQIGTFGAEARISAIRYASTGAPVVLTDITEPIEVETLVARGPGRPPHEGGRVELALHGTDEVSQTLVLDAPAPTIVAHVFTVPVAADGRTGLRSGRYTVDVSIRGGDGRLLATSAPLYLEIRGSP